MVETVKFCCPTCHGDLDRSQPESWRCPACARSFPILAGIPDFRVFDSVYGSAERDRERVQRLLEAYPTASFADLVDVRYAGADGLPDDLRNTYRSYRLNTLSREKARLSQAQQLFAQAGVSFPDGGAALEVGCGTGGALAALARRFTWAAGIDVNMVDLILARKLLEEQGLSNVTLACACAEALPFPAGTFHFAEALDVIEHVVSQPDVLAEAHRVLADGGAFWFTSPNRFYLYGPEPHVFLWGVGFLPRRLQNVYTRLVKGVEYRGKRLLSRGELVRVLRQAGLAHYTIIDPAPPIDPAQPAETRLGRLGRRLTPWLVGVVNRTIPYFGIEHQIIVTR